MGDRQRRIQECLSAGSWSLEALIRQLGDKRELVLASVQRLERAGRVQVIGKRGKDCRGAVVELVAEADPNLGPDTSSPRRQQAADLAAIAERWASR